MLGTELEKRVLRSSIHR